MKRSVMMKSLLFAAVLLLSVMSLRPAMATGDTLAQDKKEAEALAAEIIKAREDAAETLAKAGRPVSEQAFVKAYGKVYGRIAQLQKTKGIYIAFSSTWPRNPDNAATPFELKLISRFKKDPGFKRFWTNTIVMDQSYNRLVMPIFVKKSCLLCHGAGDKRPAFIVKRYPQDKSFGFKEGDIIGVISVYIPNEE